MSKDVHGQTQKWPMRSSSPFKERKRRKETKEKLLQADEKESGWGWSLTFQRMSIGKPIVADDAGTANQKNYSLQ